MGRKRLNRDPGSGAATFGNGAVAILVGSTIAIALWLAAVR